MKRGQPAKPIVVAIVEKPIHMYFKADDEINGTFNGEKFSQIIRQFSIRDYKWCQQDSTTTKQCLNPAKNQRKAKTRTRMHIKPRGAAIGIRNVYSEKIPTIALL